MPEKVRVLFPRCPPWASGFRNPGDGVAAQRLTRGLGVRFSGPVSGPYEVAFRTLRTGLKPRRNRRFGPGQVICPVRPIHVARYTELVKAGSNWLELAGSGCPENRQTPEKLKPISVLLEKPIFPAEKGQPGRPSWLNGVSAGALLSGQNCPPLPSCPAPNPALSASPPLL